MRTSHASRLCMSLLLVLMSAPAQVPTVRQPAAHVPAPDLQQPAVHWAEAAAANEERIVNPDKSFPLRYRVHRVNDRGESTRELIETNDGTIARTLEINNQPLTTDEAADERKRLTDILNSPESFQRHVQRDEGSKAYATELLRSMPRAMLWSYAAGQPQASGLPVTAVVLDFKPDPAFKPPSLVTEGLTGIAGRLWIDPASRCVLRIEGRILHPLNFGWGGVLARVREGGTVEMEQRPVGMHRWLYTHFAEHLTIREVLVHTVEENSTMDTFAARPLPGPVSLREGIQLLLAIPAPVR